MLEWSLYAYREQNKPACGPCCPTYIRSCDVIDLVVLCLIGLSEVKILSSSTPITAWAIFCQWGDELLAQKFLQIAQIFSKKLKRKVV